MTSAIIGLGLIVFGLVLWFARKAGSDAANKGAATDALKDINDALRPPTNDELKRVQSKYQRD